MIFQSAALFDSLTVLENVMFPLDMFSNDTYRDRLRRAQFCLDRVNLIEAQNKYPGEISGGMQKRVAIARAIALNPQYLFCDEPNSGLDPKTSLVIDELIHDITTEYNMTTIINTHDMNSVMGIGDSILYIYQGHKEWEGTKNDVFTATNERLNNFIFASDLLRKVKEEEIREMEKKNKEIIHHREEPVCSCSPELMTNLFAFSRWDTLISKKICLCIRIETFRPCSNKSNETVSYSYSETVSFDFNIKYFISV